MRLDNFIIFRSTKDCIDLNVIDRIFIYALLLANFVAKYSVIPYENYANTFDLRND